MTITANILTAVFAAVRAHEPLLGELDGVAGDGDLGITMTRACAAIEAQLGELQALPLSDLLGRIGGTIAREAPSTAGTLIAFGLIDASASVTSSGARAIVDLLDAIATGISTAGGAAPGDKTMLDALDPAQRAASDALYEGVDERAVLERAAEAAEIGAESTASMVPKFGRASWLVERSAGNRDAGATLVAIVLRAIADAS